jgi:hypothetical protein
MGLCVGHCYDADAHGRDVSAGLELIGVVTAATASDDGSGPVRATAPKRPRSDTGSHASSSSRRAAATASAPARPLGLPSTPELQRMGYQRIGDGMAQVELDGVQQPLCTPSQKRSARTAVARSKC